MPPSFRAGFAEGAAARAYSTPRRGAARWPAPKAGLKAAVHCRWSTGVVMVAVGAEPAIACLCRPSGRSRVRRTLMLLAVLAGLTLLLSPLSSRVAAQQTGGAGDRGRQLYLQTCSSCHGVNPNGPSNYATVPALN